MDKQNPNQATESMGEQMREGTRKGAEMGYNLSKQILDAWASTTEATLKASFDLQNAAIDSGRSLIGPEGNSNQALYQQWANSVRMAQQATLDALDATKRLTNDF